MDLYEANPQMTPQILVKLLPAILGCPLSFPPPSPLIDSLIFCKQEVLGLLHI